jgi:hypothetical protein
MASLPSVCRPMYVDGSDMSTPVSIPQVMADIDYVRNTYPLARSKHTGTHEDVYDVYAIYDETKDIWTDCIGRGTFAVAWSQAATAVENRTNIRGE